MKEVLNHTKHLEVTFDKLLSLLFTDEEFNLICLAKDDAASLFSQRSAWIKTSDLVREGVTTENMALIHLLWFQRAGRIVIEDIDPFSGAVCLHLYFQDIEKEREQIRKNNCKS